MNAPTDGDAATGRASGVCPRCGEPVEAEHLFCEVCGAPLQPAARAAPPPDASVAGMGAVGGAAQPQPGEEIGGVDADSVQFDAAARPGGPPRRPGVQVVDVDLTASAGSCEQCAGTVAADGYCEQCGAPARRPRDHWVEQPAAWVAAVCDRGIRHAINQDAVAVAAHAAAGSFAALVVCDGVSSAARSEVASLAAARAARDVLISPPPSEPPAADLAPTEPPPSEPPPSEPPPSEPPAADLAPTEPAGLPLAPERDLRSASSSVRSRASVLAGLMRAAGAAAQDQADAAASDPPERNPPACTFVAAVIDAPVLVAGWVGDSRVYWLPDVGTPVQLTEDDSLAGEAIAQGLVPRLDAERSPHAHSITRWLGCDAPQPQPRTTVARLDVAGWVLVCSDGLWNYCSEASAMRDLVQHTARQVGADPATTGEALVTWANEQGGHDNISVALARID